MVIENNSRESITLDAFKSSCECLRLAGLPLTIAAAGSGAAELEFDPSAEPSFTGALRIEMAALAGGRRVVRFAVCVSVEPSRSAGPVPGGPLQ